MSIELIIPDEAIKSEEEEVRKKEWKKLLLA